MIHSPIEALGAVIASERANGEDLSVCCFRLGELLLLTRRLAKGLQRVPQELLELSKSLSSVLAGWYRNSEAVRPDSVLGHYIEFILTGGLPESEDVGDTA